MSPIIIDGTTQGSGGGGGASVDLTDYIKRQDLWPGMSVVGEWYASEFMSGIGTIVLGTSNLRFSPIFIPRTLNLDAIGLEIATAGGAGAIARLGLYSDLNGKPALLLHEFGTVATDSVGFKSIVTGTPLTLTRGIYWTAVVGEVLTSTARSMTGSGIFMPHGGTSSTAIVLGYVLGGVGGGVLPADVTASTFTTNNTPPKPSWRLAS